MEKDIPSNIKHYISEIGDRLWSGHASIMVGAGFSKNAQKANSSAKPFPNWTELGDTFYEKLNARKPTDCDKAYLNVLKLADEIEVAFGKEYLNNLIKKELPDNEYIPSELHVKMLSLPWRDVFTTNYDTLLERSADLIIERRYEIVTNKHDLVWSTPPRIVKLHGSFPSERPFIISGEDYRLYPHKYAPFVNTVQQSLLENTLCLIGFSGDDPNFLNWIGWIRDNLGKENSPKIFLVGVLSLSPGQTRLLEERNIIPVDLSGFCVKQTDHYIALDEFANSLNKLNFSNAEDWGSKDIAYRDSNDNHIEVLNQWSKLRCEYPGWLILPAGKREMLIDNTESVRLSEKFISKFSNPNDLLFLFEFNWRLEKGLHPIINDWAVIYESVIAKYNPFYEEVQIEGAITRLTNNELDWVRIKNAWLVLQFALLRLHREEGWNDKWTILTNRIDKISLYLSAEQRAQYCYEKCLYHAYNFELAELKDCISNWPVDMSLPYWEAKRATLIAEFDSTTDAVKILEYALKEVRSRLNLSPIKDNYSLVSMEAYIMLLHRYIAKADEIKRREYFSDRKDNYQKRWQDLKQYESDPWGELKNFELQMRPITDSPLKQKKIMSFDIGHSTTNYKLGGDQSFRLACGYFRFIEEVGIPYHLPFLNTLNNDTFNNALSIIAACSPFSGNVAMVRSGNNKSVNFIYNRLSLSKMSKTQVSAHISQYAKLLRQTYKINQARSDGDNIMSSISSTLPEIISRLCCKATYESRIEILEIVKDIYISNIVSSYEHIDELIKRLVRSFSAEEQYQLIPIFIDFPIYFDRSENGKYDPFQYIDVVKIFNSIIISKQVVDDLISKLLIDDYARTIAYRRLNVLLDYNLLKPQQVTRMAANSWKIVNQYGFPTKIGYYYFSFLGLPYPKNIAPGNILREYIANTPFPINSHQEDHSIGFSRGNIPLFINIAGTHNYKDQYKWTSDEINKLISNIIEWWDADKHYLLDSERYFGPSVADEFKSRFVLIKNIITTIISEHHQYVDGSNVAHLRRMINEIPGYDINNIEIKSSLLSIYNDFEMLENEITIMLSSDIEDKVLDGVNAVITLINGENNISNLIEIVASNFRCGKKEGLGYGIDCLYQILYKEKTNISPQALRNIELGLLYMISYTRVNYGDSEDDVNEKINIARRIAKLLIYYNNYNPNSEAFSKWIEIICDDNEFAEITSQYKNTTTMYTYKENAIIR